MTRAHDGLCFGRRFDIRRQQRPRAVEESARALNSLIVPFGVLLRRADEELVEADGVGAELRDEAVRTDDVALRLGHFLDFAALLAVSPDHPLVEKVRERLGEWHVTRVE